MPCKKKKDDKPQYKLVAFLDTETNTFTGEDKRKHAITILYQINDLRDCDLSQYTMECDHIKLFRWESETVKWFESLIEWGKEHNVIPIVAAYNLRYDIQSIFDRLHWFHKMTVSAQNSMNIYHLDLKEGNSTVLRFWDMFFLNTKGLDEMGRMCGVYKLHTWDYRKQRTPLTELTADEIAYAKRDVQILPAYCAWILNVNPWIDADMFGTRIMTSTSIVRQYGANKYKRIKSTKKGTVNRNFRTRAWQEVAKSFNSYATQKACLRGGLSFTSAITANVIQHNVCSLDATSMHIQFLGMRIPVNFSPCTADNLNRFAQKILETSVDDVLNHYSMPFSACFNACFEFRNLRLRHGTVFDKCGIATLARQKFVKDVEFYPETIRDDRAEKQEYVLRCGGYHDIAKNPVFALGKLYECTSCQVWLTEIELWIMQQVYEWDEMKAIKGEVSLNYRRAPELLLLTAMDYYVQKNDLKEILKSYDGNPFTGSIPATIPDNIRENIKEGTWSREELHRYYDFVKSCLNSIYGTQVQDAYKPSHEVTDDTEIVLDESTICDEDNFESRKPRQNKVLYNFGLRIVGRSRLHLILAMMMLDNKWSDAITILGGDTDSLKISIHDNGVTPQQLTESLESLHNASDRLFTRAWNVIELKYPHMYHAMPDMGHFVAEKCGKHSYVYPSHIEIWNKCRVSVDSQNIPHVTCAGLAKSPDTIDIEDVYFNMIRSHGVDWALTHGIGYNTIIPASVAHNMGRTTPKSADILHVSIPDYNGEIFEGDVHEAIGLYEIGKTLGDITAPENMETILYLENKYKRLTDFRMKWIGLHECGMLGTVTDTY